MQNTTKGKILWRAVPHMSGESARITDKGICMTFNIERSIRSVLAILRSEIHL